MVERVLLSINKIGQFLVLKSFFPLLQKSLLIFNNDYCETLATGQTILPSLLLNRISQFTNTFQYVMMLCKDTGDHLNWRKLNKRRKTKWIGDAVGACLSRHGTSAIASRIGHQFNNRSSLLQIASAYKSPRRSYSLNFSISFMTRRVHKVIIGL